MSLYCPLDCYFLFLPAITLIKQMIILLLSKCSQIIDILQEVKETIFTNDIEQCIEKVNEHLKTIKDKTLLEILERIKLFLDRKELYEAKLYIMLELGNFKDTTPYTCKNTIYDNYDYFCKNCSNYNCRQNKKNENS